MDRNLIHIYWGPLRFFSYGLCLTLLSDAELKCATETASRARKIEFVKTRAIVRSILSAWQQVDAAAIEFEVGNFGKPVLSYPKYAARDALHFNVSHCSGYAIVAVSHTRVGVDLEHVDPDMDASAVFTIAELCFHPREQALLRSLENGRVRNAFFTIWTRKEAYIKAIGCGFSRDPASILAIRDRPAPRSDPSAWNVFDLELGDGLKAALAAPAPRVSVIAHDIAACLPSLTYAPLRRTAVPRCCNPTSAKKIDNVQGCLVFEFS